MFNIFKTDSKTNEKIGKVIEVLAPIIIGLGFALRAYQLKDDNVDSITASFVVLSLILFAIVVYFLSEKKPGTEEKVSIVFGIFTIIIFAIFFIILVLKLKNPEIDAGWTVFISLIGTLGCLVGIFFSSTKFLKSEKIYKKPTVNE